MSITVLTNAIPCKYDYACFRNRCQKLIPKTINLFCALCFQSIFVLSTFEIPSISHPNNVEKHQTKLNCNKHSQKFCPRTKHNNAACCSQRCVNLKNTWLSSSAFTNRMMIFPGLRNVSFLEKNIIWHAIVPRNLPFHTWKSWKAGASGRDDTVPTSSICPS